MKKQIIMFFAAAIAATAAFAEPEVTDVVARQRYPWNGLVDITCKVTGINETTNGLKFAVAAVNQNSGDVRRVYNFWVVQNGTKSTDRKVHANGDYRLLWDAKADLGTGLHSNIVVRVTAVDVHGQVQLWEGGPYWAEMNIGAEEAYEYGYYFWWGDTLGYKRMNNVWVASDGSSSDFSFDSSGTSTINKDIATLQSEGWIMANESIPSLPSEGWITAHSVLVPAHDAAHVHWGGNWRMPTNQEFSDLNSKCDWIWTTMNGVNGYVVRGKGDYASNSIFLPVAGCGDGTSLDGVGSYSGYWSSVPASGGGYAWCLGFTSIGHGTDFLNNYLYFGQPVRPVQGGAE